MNEDKNFNDIKIKRPSILWYWFPALFFRVFNRFYFGQRIKKDWKFKGLKGPVLAIANHSTQLDVLLDLPALLPKRYNMVTGKDVYMWKSLRPFVKAFGCIPKSQGAVDVMGMKLIKAAVEKGRNIIIYPEGKTSLDGKNLANMGVGVAKFIKFLDCNVVSLKTMGAFLTRPRFSKHERRGRLETSVDVLYTAEELKKASPKDVYAKVCDALSFNDNIWQRENKVRFKSKAPAENLNYILYKCPKCGAEYEMTSDGNTLRCGSCANAVTYTQYGQLITHGDSVAFDRIDLWTDFEREELRKEISQGNFYLSKPVEYFVQDMEKMEMVLRGTGELYIDDTHIGYKGTCDGQEYEEKTELKNLSTIITKTKEGVDLMFDDVIHRYMFAEKKWSTKYCFAVEQHYDLKR